LLLAVAEHGDFHRPAVGSLLDEPRELPGTANALSVVLDDHVAFAQARLFRRAVLVDFVDPDPAGRGRDIDIADPHAQLGAPALEHEHVTAPPSRLNPNVLSANHGNGPTNSKYEPDQEHAKLQILHNVLLLDPPKPGMQAGEGEPQHRLT
jgi:hypothetical protein